MLYYIYIHITKHIPVKSDLYELYSLRLCVYNLGRPSGDSFGVLVVVADDGGGGRDESLFRAAAV